MSAEPAPHLHLVNPETGELVDDCPGCSERDDQIRGLERVIRSQASTIAKLERDRERSARTHERWSEAETIFNFWRVKCHHPRATFDAARFELMIPYLEREGPELCRLAIEGAAFDPFTTRRKNGSAKRHDGWELIFRDRGKFEEFCNRAPRDARRPAA